LKYLKDSSIDFFANCWCDNSDYWSVYYYVIENVYNEFKRKGISVPYNQVEVRERKDKVVMPVVGKALPERIEKVREKKDEKFDLENADLTKIFKSKRKDKKSAKMAEKEKAKNKEITDEKSTEEKAVKESKSSEENTLEKSTAKKSKTNKK
jgi:hypothetical protein